MAATASFLNARSRGGRWLVRMEDVDRPREQPGAADLILRALEGYGLAWDGTVLRQSQRTQHYRRALERLEARGLTYHCDCSRSRIAARARRLPDGGFLYPGTCRERSTPPTGPVAVRLRTGEARIRFADALQGTVESSLADEAGDFVLYRRDGLFAYHLAVVVDDADQQIDEIVRGIDLLPCTAPQIYLQRCLDLPTPAYAHIPIAVNEAGQKLSKQTGARAVDPAGDRRVLWDVLDALSQSPPASLRGAAIEELIAWGIAAWDLTRMNGRKTWRMP